MAKISYNELDYACAVARLRALENHLLGAGGLEKLLSAQDAEEAAKTLPNLGWKAAGDFEEMLQSEMAGVFSLIESLGGGAFLKTQRVKYDYHNLKVLIKAELTRQSDGGLLVDLGNISVSGMKNAVANRDYRELTPAMQTAVAQAYEQYARIADAQLVDIILDGALFHDMNGYAQSLPEGTTLALVKTQIDMHNIKTFVRVRKMGKAHDFMDKAIAAGGTVLPEFYLENIGAPDGGEAGLFERTPYAAALAQGESLELALDNLFMEKVRAARSGAFGLAPLAAYFFMKENEIRNVRIILTCKNAGIGEELIRSRLRGAT